MSKKIEKVFELFTNGDIVEAEKLFRKFVLEQASQINRKIAEQEEVVEYMERDMGNDLHSDISDDMNEIDAEEMYDGIDHDDMCEDDDMDIGAEDDDLVLDLTGGEGEAVEVAHKIDDIGNKVDSIADELDRHFEELQAEIANIRAEHGEDISDDDDMDMSDIDGDVDSDDEDGHLEMNTDDEDGLGESIELHKVSVDMKDKSVGGKSGVASGKKKLELGGKPVVTKKTDSAKIVSDKAEAMKGGNTVDKAKNALIKESKETKSSVAESIIKLHKTRK